MAGGGYGAHGPGVPLGERGKAPRADGGDRPWAPNPMPAADEMRRAGLGQDGQVPADVD